MTCRCETCFNLARGHGDFNLPVTHACGDSAVVYIPRPKAARFISTEEHPRSVLHKWGGGDLPLCRPCGRHYYGCGYRLRKLRLELAA